MGNLITLLGGTGPFAALPMEIKIHIWNALRTDDEAMASRIVNLLINKRTLLLHQVNVGMQNALQMGVPNPYLGDLQYRLSTERWQLLINSNSDIVNQTGYRDPRADRFHGRRFPYLALLQDVMYNRRRAATDIEYHTKLHLEDMEEMARDVDATEEEFDAADVDQVVQRHVSPRLHHPGQGTHLWD